MVSSLNGVGSFHPTLLKQLHEQYGSTLMQTLRKLTSWLADIDWERLLDTTDVNQALRNWEGT